MAAGLIRSTEKLLTLDLPGLLYLVIDIADIVHNA
jgi:hypothetical protein